MGDIVKDGLNKPKMILEDVFCNFPPPTPIPIPIPIPSSPLTTTADDSFVDQLLNFNNIDLIQPPHFQQQQQQQQQQFNNTTTSLVVNSQQVHVAEDKDKDTSFLSLPINTAEEADLEWVSHFVDDSFSPYSTPFPPGYTKPEPDIHEREPKRRKRARVRSMSELDSSSPLAPKKGGEQRSCSHCGTRRTPQWRGGPKGAKTLCNACGVRFKSGRLLPEYRPASSLTYSTHLHSNSHRKVMEIRRLKKNNHKG